MSQRFSRAWRRKRARWTYPPNVRRIQITIDEVLDAALAAEAARRRTSKAALIREFVLERLGGRKDGPDPMFPLIGDIEEEAGDIDKVIYGA